MSSETVDMPPETDLFFRISNWDEGGRAFRLERRGLPTATPPWMLLNSRQLHAGVHLRPIVQQARQEVDATSTRNHDAR